MKFGLCHRWFGAFERNAVKLNAYHDLENKSLMLHSRQMLGMPESQILNLVEQIKNKINCHKDLNQVYFLRRRSIANFEKRPKEAFMNFFFASSFRNLDVPWIFKLQFKAIQIKQFCFRSFFLKLSQKINKMAAFS